jgi:hypothetical protein
MLKALNLNNRPACGTENKKTLVTTPTELNFDNFSTFNTFGVAKVYIFNRPAGRDGYPNSIPSG